MAAERSGEFFFGLGSLSRRYRVSFVEDDETRRLRLLLASMTGDGALLFDPTSVDAIADAVARMATDGGLRSMLIAQGRERIKMFSWEQAAQTFRPLYREGAGGRLTEEDRWLLSETT